MCGKSIFNFPNTNRLLLSATVSNGAIEDAKMLVELTGSLNKIGETLFGTTFGSCEVFHVWNYRLDFFFEYFCRPV